MRILPFLLLLVLLAPELGAQERSPYVPLELGVQLSWLPLYLGDATVGSAHASGVALHASYVLPTSARQLALEAAYTHVSQDRDPYDRNPRFDLISLRLRVCPLPESSRPNLFWFGGAGVEHIGAEELPPCDPEAGCFAEGGPSFADATLRTLVFGAGIRFPLSRKLDIRADLTFHRPWDVSQAEPASNRSARVELGGGVTVRL